jgi:short-subunit dehydrogenase
VTVQALCPGLTHTEFHAHEGSASAARMPEFMWMSAEAVVAASLTGLAAGQAICIPGWGNHLLRLLGSNPLAEFVLPYVIR